MAPKIYRLLHTYTPPPTSNSSSTPDDQLSCPAGTLVIRIKPNPRSFLPSFLSHRGWVFVKTLDASSALGWLPAAYLTPEPTSGYFRANVDTRKEGQKDFGITRGEVVWVGKVRWKADGIPGSYNYKKLDGTSKKGLVVGSCLDREPEKAKPSTKAPSAPPSSKVKCCGDVADVGDFQKGDEWSESKTLDDGDSGLDSIFGEGKVEGEDIKEEGKGE